MSAQIVLLPVFVLVGLTFAFLLVGARRGVLAGGETLTPQSELPLLFYTLVALALPLRHADLVIVLLSWVFVVTCFAQAGIFATSNDARRRSMASLAGAMVLFAMWIYFALRILLLI
ncbi:MAPEG family protein [Bradyrhizobium sp. AZCC 2289]|uniref:MAPEG family protein n=1 Tax=Bradyrhizobium sp. AZCC 2289 TaxID=3117026 RepID=UPI002FF3E268